MATSFLYGCLLLFVLAQRAPPGQATATTGDSCGAQLVSKPGLGIADPSNNLPAMATSLDAFSVSSAEECRAKCCSEPNCNLAMTEDADGAKTCYLANCLYNGINVCALGPAPGMHSYQQEVGTKPTLTDYCTGKPEKLSCRALMEMWWYDAEKKSCTMFSYGGCNGNLNLYDKEADCLKKCKHYKNPSDNMSASKRMVASDSQLGNQDSKPDPRKLQDERGNSFQEYCAAPRVTGPCRAAFTRWYYDITSSSCTKFIYGGCKGNKNNYISKEKCDQQCANRTDEHENYDPLRPFHHSTTAVALAVLLAIMIAILLGAVVVVFVKMARRHHRDSGLAAVWSPIDDKECLMNNAYTL